MGSKVSRGSDASGMRWIPIDQVEAWVKNPRHNDGAVADIARSLLRFGFVAPAVVWRERGELRAGHTRLKAVRFLQSNQPTYDDKGGFTGWEDRAPNNPFHVIAERTADSVIHAPTRDSVPVRWVDFASEAEADAYALADNRLGELAEWDSVGLADILSHLQDSDLDLSSLGWKEEELVGMMSPASIDDVKWKTFDETLSAPAGGKSLTCPKCQHVFKG